VCCATRMKFVTASAQKKKCCWVTRTHYCRVVFKSGRVSRPRWLSCHAQTPLVLQALTTPNTHVRCSADAAKSFVKPEILPNVPNPRNILKTVAHQYHGHLLCIRGLWTVEGRL
jgi:hypothetical protein